MDDGLSKLFNNFDHGTISRRQLLQALGIAAVAAPMSAFAQGRCGGARAGTPECDTTPAKAPFEPTGWKTVYMDHFSLQATDYKQRGRVLRGAHELEGQKRRRQPRRSRYWRRRRQCRDSRRILAPPAPAASPANGRRQRWRRPRWRPRKSRRRSARCGIRSAWGIDQWDAKKVEAELRKRGLNPVADNDGKDFQSFHVKDPDGFDVQITNGNRKNRRQGPANGKSSRPPRHSSRPSCKTVWLDHISFAVTNYKESAAFYIALLGWKPGRDEGSQNECEIGDLGNIIIRGGGGGGRGGAAGDTTGGRGGQAPARRAVINHISFGLGIGIRIRSRLSWTSAD